MFRPMFSPILRSNLTVYTALVQRTDLLPTGVTGRQQVGEGRKDYVKEKF
jgi:hypothetical protein